MDVTGAAVSWVAAHGGAGATTLADVLGGADVGARWPDPERGEPTQVLLVGRTHAAGLQAVSRLLEALHDGRCPPELRLLGIALMADAPGRLPLSLGRRIRVLAAAAPTFRVPWVPAWRVGRRDERLPKQAEELEKVVSAHRFGEVSP